ncbi:hypothetical protein BB560_006315, partial [Smittium megazygosporum]
AITNIVFYRVGKTDPVTNMIMILARYYDIGSVDNQYLSQQLSFFFVGIMVFFSIRGILIKLTKAFNIFSNYVSTSNVVLFYSQIMGMYSLSMLLMLRMSLPVQYQSLITMSLGSLEFQFYQRWADVIFVFAALFSLVFIYCMHQIQQDKYEELDYSAAYPNELEYDDYSQDSNSGHDSLSINI